MDVIPRALTIAGSDSGGGAGIQADLKTFLALGVYGMSAITSVTAQNTLDVFAIHDVPAGIIRAQIGAVLDDIGVDVVKTGMLHTVEIIDVVSEELSDRRFPIIVDPVMVAKSGARLFKPEAKKALVDKLFPLTTVLTPNVYEANVLSGTEISSLEEAKRAALKISELGPRAVVVKGGHMPMREEVIDVLYVDGEFELFGGEVIDTKNKHGTGCSFASAIAANLAKKRSIRDSVLNAKEFITKAIRFGLDVGRGHGPVNHGANLYGEAEKYKTWKNVLDAIKVIESDSRVALLVPEVQMNLVMATSYATSTSDVVAVPGRIVRLGDRVKASSCPEFGASRHVASTVLTVMKRDSSIRSGMNIRYSPEIISVCKDLGFKIASYDRREEPQELKGVEGATVSWGTKVALDSVDLTPDIIYHLGDWGKEAMVTILGHSGTEVVEKALKIGEKLGKRRS